MKDLRDLKDFDVNNLPHQASRVRVSGHAARSTLFGTLHWAAAIKALQKQLSAI